jgi:hypothetical protein
MEEERSEPREICPEPRAGAAAPAERRLGQDAAHADAFGERHRQPLRSRPVEAAVREFFRRTRAVSAVVYSFERDMMGLLPSGKPFTVAMGLGMYLNEASAPPEPFRWLKRQLEDDDSEREMALVDLVRRRLSGSSDDQAARASHSYLLRR